MRERYCKSCLMKHESLHMFRYRLDCPGNFTTFNSRTEAYYNHECLAMCTCVGREFGIVEKCAVLVLICTLTLAIPTSLGVMQLVVSPIKQQQSSICTFSESYTARTPDSNGYKREHHKDFNSLMREHSNGASE